MQLKQQFQTLSSRVSADYTDYICGILDESFRGDVEKESTSTTVKNQYFKVKTFYHTLVSGLECGNNLTLSKGNIEK